MRGTSRRAMMLISALPFAGLPAHAADVLAAVVNNGYVGAVENTTRFFGDFTNSAGATVKNTGGTIRFLGSFTNNGAYHSDPADNYFTDVHVGESGYFVGGPGDRFFVSGDFISASTQNALWDTAEAELIFRGGADNLHALSVTGADAGADPAGWSDNFAWGALRIEPAQWVALADGNAAAGGALYLGTLDFAGVGSWIDMRGAGLNVYYLNGGAPKQLFYGDATLTGEVDFVDLGVLATNYEQTHRTWVQGDFSGDGVVNFIDLGLLATYYDSVTPGRTGGVPEPGAMALVSLGAAAILRRRRR